MKSFRKYLVFAVIMAMLAVCMSCGKSEETKEPEKESIQVEEPEDKVEEEQEEVEEAPAEELTEENQDSETVESEEVFLLTGTYMSTLIGTAEFDADPYIESVEIEDGYLVINGSLKGVIEDEAEEDMDDTDDQDDQEDMDDADEDDSQDFIESGIYRFRITDETAFYSAGGSLGAISITIDEFVELAHYYNGLGMILEIEDGVIEEVTITS